MADEKTEHSGKSKGEIMSNIATEYIHSPFRFTQRQGKDKEKKG